MIFVLILCGIVMGVGVSLMEAGDDASGCAGACLFFSAAAWLAWRLVTLS